jgi:hypothetical protein
MDRGILLIAGHLEVIRVVARTESKVDAKRTEVPPVLFDVING